MTDNEWIAYIFLGGIVSFVGLLAASDARTSKGTWLCFTPAIVWLAPVVLRLFVKVILE